MRLRLKLLNDENMGLLHAAGKSCIIFMQRDKNRSWINFLCNKIMFTIESVKLSYVTFIYIFLYSLIDTVTSGLWLFLKSDVGGRKEEERAGYKTHKVTCLRYRTTKTRCVKWVWNRIFSKLNKQPRWCQSSFFFQIGKAYRALHHQNLWGKRPTAKRCPNTPAEEHVEMPLHLTCWLRMIWLQPCSVCCVCKSHCLLTRAGILLEFHVF